MLDDIRSRTLKTIGRSIVLDGLWLVKFSSHLVKETPYDGRGIQFIAFRRHIWHTGAAFATVKWKGKRVMPSLVQRYAREIEQFIAVCHTLAERLYVTGHGGNLAWRLDEDLILITPTQVNKGDVTPDKVVFVTMQGETIEGSYRPTGETPMYLNFFRERPDIVSVIHCHPPKTGAFAILEGENWLMRPMYPETTTEVGPVPLVPYGEPLTQRLADNFLPYLRKYNAFLMENHGLVIMTRQGIDWTLMMTELLEQTSDSLLAALAVGGIKELSVEDVRNLDNILKTRDLPLFGAPGVNTSLVDLYFPE